MPLCYCGDMNINELVIELNELVAEGHGEIEVVLAKDEEGNGFRVLAEVGEVSTMVGEGSELDFLYEDDDDPEDPADYPDALTAVVLW